MKEFYQTFYFDKARFNTDTMNQAIEAIKYKVLDEGVKVNAESNDLSADGRSELTGDTGDEETGRRKAE